MRIRAATLLIAASLLGAAAVAACSGSTPSHEFKTILGLADENYSLPVVVRDETSLVTRIEAGPSDPTFNYMGAAARADPADPNAFIVSWMGGACDNDAVLWFTRGDAVYALSVEVHGKFSLFGGCPALGVPRDVRIVTSSPIPIDSIVAAGGT